RRLQGAIEAVHDRKKRFDCVGKRVITIILLLFCSALAGIIELRLHARQSVEQSVTLGAEFLYLRTLVRCRWLGSCAGLLVASIGRWEFVLDIHGLFFVMCFPVASGHKLLTHSRSEFC